MHIDQTDWRALVESTRESIRENLRQVYLEEGKDPADVDTLEILKWADEEQEDGDRYCGHHQPGDHAGGDGGDFTLFGDEPVRDTRNLERGADTISLSEHTISGREHLAAGAQLVLEQARKAVISLPTIGAVVSLADLEEMVEAVGRE